MPQSGLNLYQMPHREHPDPSNIGYLLIPPPSSFLMRTVGDCYLGSEIGGTVTTRAVSYTAEGAEQPRPPALAAAFAMCNPNMISAAVI